MRSRLAFAAIVPAVLGFDVVHAQPGPLPEDTASEGSDAPAAPDPSAVTTPQGMPQQAMPPAPPPPPAEVVVKESMNRTNAALLVGAGTGVGAGICLLVAAYYADGDADAAASYEDHASISARADRMRIAGVVTGAAGVALGALAIYRIKVSKEGTTLSLRPRTSGAALVLERRW